jgi:hypothetical protein
MSEIIAKLLTGILVFYQLLFLLCMISFEAFVLCELGKRAQMSQAAGCRKEDKTSQVQRIWS